jgi:hypothetical protein
MNNMKNLRIASLLAIFLFGIIFRIYGQKHYLDSINVQIGNKMEVNMIIFNYDHLRENMERDLKSLQTILLDRKEPPVQGAYAITYQPNAKLSIKPEEAGERIIWDKGGLTRYVFNNRLSIMSHKYLLQVQFNDPAEIVSEDLQKNLLEVIDSTISMKGRLTEVYHFSYQDGKLVHSSQLDQPIGQKDVLTLNGGVGINLVKSQYVIDLSAQLGLLFCKKGIWRNQYYLSYNQLSYFPDLSNPKLNGFLNIGYKYNLSNIVGKPDWLGIEIGYLVNRQGELFRENTMRLGFNWDIEKYISVAPQVYVSGDFKEIFPAVRIGFGF